VISDSCMFSFSFSAMSTPVISILSAVSLSGSLLSFTIFPSLLVNVISLCFLHAAVNWCTVDIILAGLGSTVQFFYHSFACVEAQGIIAPLFIAHGA